MNRPLFSRRESVKVAAAAGMGAWGLAAASQAAEPTPHDRLSVNVAGYPYDRVRAIQDGRLPLEGCVVRFHPESIYQLNKKLFGPDRPYEVSETGLIPYIIKYVNEGFRGYTLIPVFISRTFRHRNIFVRTDRGIERPEDLRGKRVATPGYGMSSHTWIRGFLQDQYGVKPDEMQWIETTESSDGGQWHSDYKKYCLPHDFPIEKGPEGVDESDLIVAGDVDALITAIEPRAYADGHPKVKRLFDDVRAVEREYYKQTQVFPIMHVVAVRRDFADKHPPLLREIFSMYSQAKQAAYDDMDTQGVLKVTLPWLNQELEETQSLMGTNFWPYGVSDNQKELELVARYTHEQGLSKRRVSVEELFHPESLAWTEA